MIAATSFFNVNTVEHDIAEVMEFSRRAGEGDVELIERIAEIVESYIDDERLGEW